MPSQKSSFLVDLGNFRETEKQTHTHTQMHKTHANLQLTAFEN